MKMVVVKKKMPKMLFAVTDVNGVLPLQVVGVNERDGFTVLTTEIDVEMGQPSEIDEYYHGRCYKKLFATEKEPTGSSCVFFGLDEVKAFAIKNLDEEIEIRLGELKELRDRRGQMVAMGN